jgi:riboflavin kinase/FMN adenylyltransferase
LAVVVALDPLPALLLGEEPAHSALSSPSERATLLKAAGADLVTLTFDDDLSQAPAEELVHGMLSGVDVCRVVIGRDARFGFGGAGGVATLERLRHRYGYAVDVVEPLTHGMDPISSRGIRDALRRGDLDLASGLLGRPYTLGGTVVHGEARGRTLGFPTLNIQPGIERLLPADGIYATWVRLGNRTYRGASNIGTRPTFGGGARRLETHVLDFDEDAYGRYVEVTFVCRLRAEVRFASAALLVRQIVEDVRQARIVLA